MKTNFLSRNDLNCFNDFLNYYNDEMWMNSYGIQLTPQKKIVSMDQMKRPLPMVEAIDCVSCNVDILSFTLYRMLTQTVLL